MSTTVEKGVHYYNGRPWSGPTNMVGYGRKARFRESRNTYVGMGGVKMTLVEETCVQPGGLSFDGHSYRSRDE